MIDIDGVNKHFGSFHALKDITARIERGSVVVVCGPSGSGKSTLIKCVNGLEKIDSGTITIDGKTLGAKGTDMSLLRAQVGMVFQNFELFPHLTILQNLTWRSARCSSARRTKRGQSRESARAGRAEAADPQVSRPAVGGQQQRVATPVRWRWTRSRCCSMSRRRRWTPR